MYTKKTIGIKIITALMILSVGFAIMAPVGIFVMLLLKSLQFFRLVPFAEFIGGTNWAPRDDVVYGHFGVIPVLMGSLSTAIVAVLTTVVVGASVGCYLAEYATRRQHYVLRIILDMFSGIPSIVYAFFVAVTCTPYFAWIARAELGFFHFDPESVLVVGFFIGILTMPFFASLIDDALRSAPRRLYHAGISMGATRTETVWHIIIPYCSRQLASSFLFALSRCIGETVIAMVAGTVIAKATLSPLASNTTATSQIVTLIMSDSDFISPRALATFALGLLLFCITFAINTVGGYIEHKKK